MQAALRLLCLLGLVVSLVLAAPAPNQIKKRSFTVERFKNPHFRRDGPRQLFKAYRKYGVRPPQALVDRFNEEERASRTEKAEAAAAAAAAASTTTSGRATSTKKKGHKNGTSTASAAKTSATSGTTKASTNSTANTGVVVNTPTTGDTEYLSPVSIGGQTLNLDFDTGSSDLWVFNTQLTTKEIGTHSAFDSSKSTSFKTLTGQKFSISYGDGSSVSGNVGTDTVEIGGATATGQAVELATTVSSSFISDANNDGLVGLAFSKLNTVTPTQQKTFFDTIKSDLALPLFAADLRANASGTYQFGAIDNSKFKGSLTYVPVNTTQGFWQFSSKSIAVGNGATQVINTAGQAIADTGTTLLLASAAVVNAYFANVTGAEENTSVGGITIPCDTTLPDLKIDVGGTMATVAGEHLVFAKVSGNTCYSGLQAISSSFMIFGDIFFKSNYVVFNGGNNTLGFASHA